mgnify:CR=1 FL=1
MLWPALQTATDSWTGLCVPLCLQVASLQHQVGALQASREAQDRELSRLRGEALALAASTAASLEGRTAAAGGAAAGAAKDQVCKGTGTGCRIIADRRDVVCWAPCRAAALSLLHMLATGRGV